MSVPESIRAVKRPVNTVVIDQGGNSSKRFAVRSRKGVKYIKGQNPQPISGEIVGYIVNGEYVPRQKQVKVEIPHFLSWGAAAFIESLSSDIVTDLLKVMDCKDALMTFVLAALRVIYPGTPNSRIRACYEKSFMRIFHPGVALSANTISKFLKNLGENQSVREAFCLERLARVAHDHHIVIDGTLIQDTSKVNDLSGFSYKARMRGCQELSVLYAYDVENCEPICAQVFPGGQPDVATCKEFLKSNHIKKGILVADKGFNLKEIRALRAQNPDLHYLIAIKRNDKRLNEHELLEMKDFLAGEQRPILCSKEQINADTWVYAFKDTVRARAEEKTFIESQHKKNNFDPEEYEERKLTFGVVAFESDQDLPYETVYETYRNRWTLELIFKQYKTGLEGNETRVQGDFSVIGSEFINFICTIITSRMVSAEKNAGLLNGFSYGSILDDLKEAWRIVRDADDPHVEDDYWVHTTIGTKSIMTKLGLVKAPKPEAPKKRGRPKKNPEEPSIPKRPRGRPRKHPLPEESTKRKPERPEKTDAQSSKRPRGRPRKVNSV